MLVAVVCLIFMLALLDQALRIGRLELLTLRTKHKLLALRDALHDASVSGSVDRKNWLFDFIDSTLLQVARNGLATYSAYHLAGFVLTDDRAAQQGEDQYARYRSELSKPENSRYRSIIGGFEKCMRDFLRSRHLIVVPSALLVGNFLLRLSDPELREKQSKALSTDPRMSTLREYCH